MGPTARWARTRALSRSEQDHACKQRLAEKDVFYATEVMRELEVRRVRECAARTPGPDRVADAKTPLFHT